MSGATLLDQFLDPLSRCLADESARRVLALGVPASVRERVDTLAEPETIANIVCFPRKAAISPITWST
jgi:hypothetical protein